MRQLRLLIIAIASNLCAGPWCVCAGQSEHANDPGDDIIIKGGSLGDTMRR